MNKIKTYFEKDSHINLVLVLIFLNSVVIRTVLGMAFGQMNVFFDELLHWNISKSIHYGLGSNFRNDILSYKEILYSAVMSFSHYFGNTEIQYYVAVGINSLLMSSVIFPVYIMSKRFLNNKQQAFIIAFVSVMLPEMVYTAKLIQENLYYPMVIWFFYIFIVFILKAPYKIKNVVLLGVYVFLISVCKQMALNIFAGVVIYYFAQFLFFDKKNRVRCMACLIGFISIFLGLKYGYGILFNLVNGISSVSSSEVTISVILGNLLDPYLLSQLLYPAITYILMSTLFFGFFTLLLPMSMMKEFSKKERNLFILICGIIISTVAVICLRIIPSENLNEVIIRFHYRYLFFLIIPIMILFFSMYEKVVQSKFNSNIIVISAVYALLINYINIIPEKGSKIDCVGANYIKYLCDSDMMVNTLRMLIIIGIVIGLYLIYKKKIKLLYGFIVLGFIASGLVNACYTYTCFYESKQDTVIKKEDAFTLNSYFNDTVNVDTNSVLIISESNVSDGRMEIYLEHPNYYYCKKAVFEEFYKNHKGESFVGLELFSFNKTFESETIGYPTYIITNKPTYVEGYDKVTDIELTNYYLYTRNTSE